MANRASKSGGVIWGVVSIVLALLLIFVPLFEGAFLNLSFAASAVVTGFGVLLLLLGAIIIVISRLYVRASTDESFVKTGSGGQKPIINGGAIVIPMLHEIQWVSHQTMKLVVERIGKDALITGDNLRTDIVAEFYIKVPKTDEAVVAAASSLGNRGINPQAVKDLMNEKLISALRTVASTQDLMGLHKDRQAFVDGVKEIVSTALEPNGLELEDTTISQLDQTRLGDMQADDNIFDAQGARKIAEVVASQRIERNKLEREADNTVAAQDASSRKAILEQDALRETAEAKTAREIAEAQAEAEAQAAVKAAEEAKRAEVAEVSRQQAVEVANVEKQKATDVAEELRQQAQREAAIEANKSVELADREAKIAIEERETARANAEAERLAAEAEAEEARQAVQTVTVTETANRDKAKALIDEAAEAEKKALRDRTEADVDAYTAVTKAQGEQESAEKLAAAKRTAAEADKDAGVLKAEADRAVQMVPVDVKAKEVAVERERLANETEFAAIASELKARLAEIDAGRDVDIARAEAMGDALSKAEMRFWGDPQTFKAMSNAFLGGQQAGMSLEGVVDGTPQSLKDAANSAVTGLGAVAANMVSKFTGQTVSEEDAMKLVQQFFKDKTPEDIAIIMKDAMPGAEDTSLEEGEAAAASVSPAEKGTINAAKVGDKPAG